MATSPIELADSASNKLRTGEALTVPDAVRKAIKGRGIDAKADFDRLAPQVMRELQRRSAEAQRAKRTAEKIAKGIAKRINR